VPTVGLLHCDCGAATSSYSPVALGDLKTLAPQVWVLGHIHKPAVLSAGDPLILYPGSPQGLDPSEQGAHGAWIITIHAGETPTLEMLPLAALRWERVDLSVDGLSQEAVLQQRVVEAIRDRHEHVREELGPTRKVGCRLCLAGRTSLHRRVRAIGTLIQQDLNPTFDGVDYFIESFEDLTRPDVSLGDLARSNDPAGLLAQQLVLLESRQPIDDYRAIIADARDAIEAQSSVPTFASLPDIAGPMSEEQVRSMLLKAGLTALDQMLAQKEAQA
jgi:DNA repair protein SbcD/Mre11